MSQDTPTPAREASAGRRLRVVTAANTGYLPGVLAMCHSLLGHLASDWSVDLTVLTDDFGPESERILRGVIAAAGRDHTLEIVEIGMDDFRDYPAQSSGSRLTYARMLCPRLIAEDQALYLDSDIVVLRDVSRLAALPWEEGRTFYAARDGSISSCSMWWERIPWEKLGIPASAPYFNGGVLWMNLAAWRREGMEAACQDYLRQYPDCLPFWDQSVMNAVLWNQWTELETAWNFAPEHTMGRFALYPVRRLRDVNIHYVSCKPWLHRHPWARYYWEQMAGIAALVPPRYNVRPPWERKLLRQWAFFFTQRAYLHYGGFVKHAALDAFRGKSARRAGRH